MTESEESNMQRSSNVMTLAGYYIVNLKRSLLQIESRLLQAAGLDRHLAPALVVNGAHVLPPQLLPLHEEETLEEGDQQHTADQPPGLLDSILWMAAPKKRRTIEVNRTRRRSDSKLLKVKNNIEPCLECGHLKQKHTLCTFCYEKVRIETGRIRQQISAMEGGPLRAPATDTVVLYEGEVPQEQDKDKRIVELTRKRPAWFS